MKKWLRRHLRIHINKLNYSFYRYFRTFGPNWRMSCSFVKLNASISSMKKNFGPFIPCSSHSCSDMNITYRLPSDLNLFSCVSVPFLIFESLLSTKCWKFSLCLITMSLKLLFESNIRFICSIMNSSYVSMAVLRKTLLKKYFLYRTMQSNLIKFNMNEICFWLDFAKNVPQSKMLFCCSIFGSMAHKHNIAFLAAWFSAWILDDSSFTEKPYLKFTSTSLWNLLCLVLSVLNETP